MARKKAFLDLETFSTVPINDGTWRYAEQAEILLFAYALEDGPIRVWDVTQNPLMPDDLVSILRDQSIELWFHNVAFDRTIIRHAMPLVYKLINEDRWRCTMVQALC